MKKLVLGPLDSSEAVSGVSNMEKHVSTRDRPHTLIAPKPLRDRGSNFVGLLDMLHGPWPDT